MFCNLFECIILLVGNTMLFQECVPCCLHFMSEDLQGNVSNVWPFIMLMLHLMALLVECTVIFLRVL